MAEKYTKPKIRFAGFTDAWEQRKLGEVARFDKGRGYSKNDLKESGDPIILYGRLYTRFETFIKSVDTFAEARPGSIYSTGKEVVVPASGETAEDIAVASAIGESGVLLGGDLNIVYPADFIEPVFLALAISTGTPQKEMAKRAQGKSVVHLRNTDLQEIDLNYPCEAEQRKIIAYFLRLDHLITLHQRKYDKLVTVKKSMLEKMFPREGETFPEVRFAGFTNAWEQRKLGEISDIYDGTHQTPRYTEEGVKFVSVENISNLETKKFISLEAYEKEYSNKQAEQGDVLMTRIGDIGTARVIETVEPLAYYVTLALLKPKQVNSGFLAWLITSPEVQRNIWKRTLHIAFPKKINLGEINQVELVVPSYDEQTRIGTFFSTLDNLITLHQRKLEKLKNLKIALLEKMFV